MAMAGAFNPGALKVYLAFCEADAGRIDSASVIRSELFGMPWIPLKSSAEAAIKAALAAKTALSMKAALEPTEWFVLELDFSTEQVARYFLNKQLWHAYDRAGSGVFRFANPLPIREAAGHSWAKIRIDATGLEVWAQNFLAKYKFAFTGVCHGCKNSGQAVWQGNHTFSQQQFCCCCWHAFMTDHFQVDDLHTGMEARKSGVLYPISDSAADDASAEGFCMLQDSSAATD